MTRVCLTGASGFIGSHVLDHLLACTDWNVVAVDSFRCKPRRDRLTEVIDNSPDAEERHQRVEVIACDLAMPFDEPSIAVIGKPDIVVAMASETDIKQSIADPVPFISDNVSIILNTLELCRKTQPRMVILISSDEVYGSVKLGSDHREWSPILPPSPYAASKAAQEAIAISYWRAYNVPVIIVNCMNPVGEMQSPDKFVPTVIRKVSRGERVTIYGEPGNISSRCYIHVGSLADALLFLMNAQSPRQFNADDGIWQPDRYNIGGVIAISNLDLAQGIAYILGKPLDYELASFDSTRPGHDPHYGLDISKLLNLGWQPPTEFWEEMKRTIHWTTAHSEWMEL